MLIKCLEHQDQQISQDNQKNLESIPVDRNISHQMRRVPPPPSGKRKPIGGPTNSSIVSAPQEFSNPQSPSGQNQNEIVSQSVADQMSLQQKVEAIKPQQMQVDLKGQIKTEQGNKNQRNQPSLNELKKQEIPNDSIIQLNQQPNEHTVSQQKIAQNTMKMKKGPPPPPNSVKRKFNQQKKIINPPKIPVIPNQMQSMQERQEEENVIQISSGLVIQSSHQLRKVQISKSIETSQDIPKVLYNQAQNQKLQKQTSSKLVQTEKQVESIKEQPPIKKLPHSVTKPPVKKVSPPIKPPNLVKPIQGNIQLDTLDKDNQVNIVSKDKSEVEDVALKIKNIPVQSETKQVSIQLIKTQFSNITKNPPLPPTKSSPIIQKRQRQELPLQQGQVMKIRTQVNLPIQNKQVDSVKSIPSQYNQLQQKLRLLEQLRSRIDESSQESYSNHDDQIQEEEQLQADNGDQQKKALIYIEEERDVDTIQQRQIAPRPGFEEYALGETNYDQMEIKQEHQKQYQVQTQTAKVQTLKIQPPHLPQQDIIYQQQQNDIPTPSSEDDSIIPIPAETVFESNLSVEQTRLQYLPDEVSNSPNNSEQSMAKHHSLAQQTGSNIVYHAENHHSQANFEKPYPYLIQKQKDHIHQQVCDGGISQKSDGQLSKPKHHPSKNQHHLKGKNQSIKPVYNQSSNDIIESGNKQNQLSDRIPKITESQILKTKQNNIGQNIQQLLRQFKTRKSQYFNNLENFKRKEEDYQSEEEKHRQRIHALMEQVNHKNLLILGHANGINDQISISDKQMETQEL